MKNIILFITLILLTACTGKFDTKNFDLRKDCSETSSKKTLADLFCKKK